MNKVQDPEDKLLTERTSGRDQRRKPRFIPNFSQLQQAIRTLPDPEACSLDSYEAELDVDGKKRSIHFKRKRITRGSSRPYRWVFEGKILVRKQDTEDG